MLEIVNLTQSPRGLPDGQVLLPGEKAQIEDKILEHPVVAAWIATRDLQARSLDLPEDASASGASKKGRA